MTPCEAVSGAKNALSAVADKLNSGNVIVAPPGELSPAAAPKSSANGELANPSEIISPATKPLQDLVLLRRICHPSAKRLMRTEGQRLVRSRKDAPASLPIAHPVNVPAIDYGDGRSAGSRVLPRTPYPVAQWLE